MLLATSKDAIHLKELGCKARVDDVAPIMCSSLVYGCVKKSLSHAQRNFSGEHDYWVSSWTLQLGSLWGSKWGVYFRVFDR